MLKEAYGVRRRVAVTWPTLDGRPSSLLVGPGAAVARTGTGPGRVRYEAASAELEVSRIERALVDTEPARCARASDQNLGDVARGHPEPWRDLLVELGVLRQESALPRVTHHQSGGCRTDRSPWRVRRRRERSWRPPRNWKWASLRTREPTAQRGEPRWSCFRTPCATRSAGSQVFGRMRGYHEWYSGRSNASRRCTSLSRTPGVRATTPSCPDEPWRAAGPPLRVSCA